MLNEHDLENILATKLPELNVKDIHWRSQDSDLDSILFYKINDDEKSQKIFSERIDHARFAWLVVNRDHPSLPKNSSIIPEAKWPSIQEAILNKLYPLPVLKLFAITGTNGKTTTADLVLQVGEFCGKRGLSIGTLGVRELNNTIHDFGLTSPSLIDLRKFLYIYGQDKDFCVIEASSHALIQQRLFGLKFDMGGWLSFSQDHLDYHGTMENYLSAKMLLFNYLKDSAIIFVPKEQEQLYFKLHKVTSKVALSKELDTDLPLFFRTTFNRNNLEVAVSIIEEAFEVRVENLFNKIMPPDGRFYIKSYKSNYIVVDFAHTPDALENICRGIKEAFPLHTLKVLFGCGGDRDKSKRPLMGKVAEAFAQEIYLTSDNPRTEDPEQIIHDILAGIADKDKTHIIIERPLAVKKAFGELGQNEILLLAGKGHENYILINGVKHPYSDINEIEKLLSGKLL